MVKRTSLPASDSTVKRAKLDDKIDISSSTSQTHPCQLLYGAEAYHTVQSSHILVVGAGGIGCELLKCLLLTGFNHISVIDLDTIDVSNLNRQFLFRRHNVGQSKAQSAVAAVQHMNPQCKLTAYHDNVKNPTYNSDWYKQFNIVLNALDNIDARRHVNRLCVNTNTSLIESGTQGYAGNVHVILPQVSECYECSPKPTPKQFAVCTIRHTPDKPIHCVVWAKMVFAALFGPTDSDNMLHDIAVLNNAVEQGADVYAQSVCTELFDTEIQKQSEVTDRWVGRAPPTPLKYDVMMSDSEQLSGIQFNTPMTAVQTAKLLSKCIKDLHTQQLIGTAEFDKDNELYMNTVAALANMRMANFAIPLQSQFTLKGIAGNIVHAIATTNAITAGQITIECVNVLTNNTGKCRVTWIKRTVPALLTAQTLDPPNKHCYICNTDNTLILRVNTNTFTIGQLYERVLIKSLSMNEPSIDVTSQDNYIGLAEDHQDDEDYMRKTLADVKCVDSSELSVDDFAQQFILKIIIKHDDTVADDDNNPDQFVLTNTAGNSADITAAAQTQSDVLPGAVNQTTNGNGTTDGSHTAHDKHDNGTDADVIEIDQVDDMPSEQRKRPLLETQCETDNKRAKVVDDDIIELDL